MEQRPRCVKLKAIFAILGIIAGISILICFIFYKNANAAAWGLLTGIFASVVYSLHRSYLKNTMHLKYTAETLRLTKLCGILCSVLAILSSITYFTLAAVLKQGYKVEGDGYAPAGVFALLALKWTFMMFWEGKRYENFLKNYPESDHGSEVRNIQTIRAPTHYGA
ncbi:hypothetical protein X975_02444, partial [Stegodyphus mimosarum]